MVCVLSPYYKFAGIYIFIKTFYVSIHNWDDRYVKFNVSVVMILEFMVQLHVQILLEVVSCTDHP